ncbi:MAG: hypothetical protein VB130_10400 [Clostridium sp.]|nr:hypothetical protein [Clostridium sp.]
MAACKITWLTHICIIEKPSVHRVVLEAALFKNSTQLHPMSCGGAGCARP